MQVIIIGSRECFLIYIFNKNVKSITYAILNSIIVVIRRNNKSFIKILIVSKNSWFIYIAIRWFASTVNYFFNHIRLVTLKY